MVADCKSATTPLFELWLFELCLVELDLQSSSIEYQDL
jgi:hypothetical protein